MSEQGNQLWSGAKSRKIVKRVVVEGTLVLQTPAHFGSGDAEGAVMPLVFDEVNNKPLLTGASLAGALRGYLSNYDTGYRSKQTAEGLTAKLFGGIRQDDRGYQSSLVVDDAYGDKPADANGEKLMIELRDGVKIEDKSRTATDNALYTFTMWSAGITFKLRFELLISERDEAENLRKALATALNGLQNSEITLGARKHRGFGRVKVKEWNVREFEMATRGDLLAWIKDGGKDLTPANSKSGNDIFSLLGISPANPKEDKRERFVMKATFALESSILIRANSTVADMGHLRSGDKPIVSGTSLTGAIRARALKIAKTLSFGPEAKKLIDGLFGAHGDNENKDKGKDKTEKRTASRITVEEREITGGNTTMVQSRVAIDRFTGGALDTALFNQQPNFGGTVQINLEIRNPKEAEIGLLLLVLKDLWTADLPIGGESSVGRGRLQGQRAELEYKGKTWTIEAERDGENLKIQGDTAELENFVTALNKEVAAA